MYLNYLVLGGALRACVCVCVCVCVSVCILHCLCIYYMCERERANSIFNKP